MSPFLPPCRYRRQDEQQNDWEQDNEDQPGEDTREKIIIFPHDHGARENQAHKQTHDKECQQYRDQELRMSLRLLG
jgi:hypothetical protein